VSEDVEQFVSDYLSEKRAKRAEKAWEAAVDEQYYRTHSQNPGELANVYAADPTLANGFARTVDRATDSTNNDGDIGVSDTARLNHPQQNWLPQAKSKFTEKMERAYYEHQGNIPLGWFMQFNPEEIELLGGPDFKEIADEIEAAQRWQATQKQYQADLDALVEERYEANLRGTSFWDKFYRIPGTMTIGFAAGLETPESEAQTATDKANILNEILLERSGQKDVLFDDQIEDFFDEDWEARVLRGNATEAEYAEFKEEKEAELRDAIRNGADPREVLNQKGTLEVAGGRFMQGMAWTFEKAASLTGLLLQTKANLQIVPTSEELGIAEHLPLPTTIDGIFRMRSEERMNELIAQQEANIPKTPQDAIREISHQGIDGAWRALEIINPKAKEDYMIMAAGDETAAFGFFAADAEESIKADEQMAEYAEELTEEQRQMVQQLKEQDFRFSAEVLDLLAMWGRNVPGRLSTGAALLFTDSDLITTAVNDGFKALWDETGRKIEQNNFTPSEVLGIDGSLAGLALDLGGGIALDPTTWIFGPRFMGGRGVRPSSAAEASALAKGPHVVQYVDDIERVMTSPSRGVGELIALTDWMDDIGFGNILQHTDIAPQILPAHNWVKAANGASAMEVRTSTLSQLLGKIDKKTKNSALPLADNIRTEGFLEPIELVYSRASETLSIGNGTKRVYASELGEISHVPAYLRVTDDVVEGGMSIHKLLSDVEGASMKKPLKALGSGDNIIRPDTLFSRRMLGDIDLDPILKEAQNSVMNGAIPHAAQKTAVARALEGHMRSDLGQLVEKGAKKISDTRLARWANKYTSFQNTVTRFELHGPGAMRELYDATNRLWGENTAKINQWQTRLVMEHKARAAHGQATVEQLQKATRLRRQVDALENLTGGQWDDSIRLSREALGVADDAAKGDVAQILKNRAQHQRELTKKSKQLDEELIKLERSQAALSDASPLAKVMEEMWDDYNRTYLVPRWQGQLFYGKKVQLTDDGLVPWEVISRSSKKVDIPSESGRTFLPDDLVSRATAAGIGDPEALFKLLSSTFDQPMSVTLPASPLELIVAREMTGAAYTRVTQAAFLSRLRETSISMTRAWIVDKVFKPSTGITVSFDELLRIWHLGGEKAMQRWAHDRAIFLEARTKAVLHRNTGVLNPLKKDAVESGAQFLSAKSQQRLRTLQDYPTRLKQAERQMYEAHGMGWTDILPDDAFHATAARQWISTMMSDSGFRSMLRGEDAFKEWFFGPDGGRVRGQTVLKKGEDGAVYTTLMSSADEAYKGWKTIFEDVVLKTARDNGKYDDVVAAFKQVADEADKIGGRATDLPDFVYQNLGPVRGFRKEIPRSAPVQHMTEKFFDRMFMDPVNYRRGFLADMVRTSENLRLEKLFASQGKRIIDDIELEQYLNIQGLGGATHPSLKPYIQDQALKAGIMPRSLLDDMVERQVAAEIDNTLFTWDQGSRLGQQSKAVFPFAQPWADMMGFWGREVLTKPTLRGWVNETNLFGMKSIVENGYLPINPRPLAMGSRLAHTDFTLDRAFSLPGQDRPGGVLPGTEKTDFSPIFFLPTGGDNPFAAMVPGLGLIPIAMIDMLVKNKYDPVTQPVEYQNLVDELADFLPAVGFQQGGMLSRIFGGGTSASVVGAGIDLAAMRGEQTFYQTTSQLGDITREISVNRELSAFFAKEEEWEALLELDDPDLVREMFDAIVLEADQAASQTHLLQSVSRLAFPAKQDFSTTVDELNDVWLEASNKFPDVLSVRPSLQGLDLTNEQNKQQYAADIRKSFFALPQWERDTLIVQYPQLTVNLVSSWKWTDQAKAAGVEGSLQIYRTTGTDEGLALHQNLIEEGYIRPMPSRERLETIIGMAAKARANVASDMYEQTAGWVNDFLWDNVVSSEDKAVLDAYVNDFGFAESWGIEDGHDLWVNWGSLEESLEEYTARLLGIEEGTEEYDDLKKRGIGITDKTKPWGTTLSLDASKQFENVPLVVFEPEVQTMADALGIELTPGMSGKQFHNAVLDGRSQVTAMAYAVAAPQYDSYIGERSAAAKSAEAALRKPLGLEQVSDEWKANLESFMFAADQEIARYKDVAGGIPLDVNRDLAQRYKVLEATAPGLSMDWQGNWDAKYSRALGPLEWTPPTPASPFGEDGKKNSNAYQPIIKTITDGDTIVVSRNQGTQELINVRLLGVRAEDYGDNDEGATEDKNRLYDALQDAIDNDEPIYLVRDPENFSNVDVYGRELAWLWIGDEPYYFEEDFRPNQEPSGPLELSERQEGVIN
jgi:hypothetical protein